MSQSEAVDESVPAPRPLQFVVRFGSMRTLGVMDARQTYRYGDQVVARTSRGTELGTVLCEATPVALESVHEPTEGRIVRRASSDDLNQCRRQEEQKGDDVAASGRAAETLGLQMEVVDVERILGGERVVVYFLSEARVDFRQLVRDLASHFQTRIEMRQIGVRDEAKLLADYGDCGRPICCASFLNKMPPVSMKMAKLQKATLDPSKISGRCGRLKCCLRYEYDTYEAISRELPSPGSVVLTRDGNVTVIAQDILSQQLMVKTDDNRRILIHGDDILAQVTPGASTDRAGRTKSKFDPSSTPTHDD
jgi:cell fate regulator YaaT (PSP1 superfamily)